MDLIIRDKNLNVANPADTSTHDLLFSLMRIEKKSSLEEKLRSNVDFQSATTQSMLVTVEKFDLNINENIELWCTLYDYSSDENGVELIPSETFVIRDKETLRTQDHVVAFTVKKEKKIFKISFFGFSKDIGRSRPMKSFACSNAISVKYLVLYVIRIGSMYLNENPKEMNDIGPINTLKKTKHETNDLRRPYLVAREFKNHNDDDEEEEEENVSICF